MTKKLLQSLIISVAGLSLSTPSQAQIVINNLGQVYNQNFDSLGTNNVVWTNETTLAGWVFVASTNGVNAGAVTNLIATDGSSILPPQPLNLGTIGALDRTLGSLAGTTLIPPVSTEFFYGARFINSSAGTITNVNISYVGEQWRDNSVNLQKIAFFHRVGGTDFLADTNNTGWTANTNLDFTSLQNTGAALVLDGNNAANRTNLTSDISVSIAPGQEFWIRWIDVDDPPIFNFDHFLGIDDLNITFTGIAAGTNNPVNPSNTVLGVSLELKRPKVAKKLVFKGLKGFKVKAFLRSTNTLTKASYAAFGGSDTNAPTNLAFTDFNKFQVLTKGKLFKKKGVNVIAQTKGAARAGAGIAAGSSPVTLVIRVDGVQGTNNASAFFTNIFTNVKVK